MDPLTPSCHPSIGMTLWPEAAKDFQRENIFLYSIVPQNGNKKADTVISRGAKCLTSHAGRTSSHLKTPVVCICSLPKSSLMAQSKQRKGMKTERKQTMRESKWGHNSEMLLITNKQTNRNQAQTLKFYSLVSINSEELCWKFHYTTLLFSYFHVGT